MSQEQVIKFAEACADQNTKDELANAILGAPDLTDMKEWNLDGYEWGRAIILALVAKQTDVSVEYAA